MDRAACWRSARQELKKLGLAMARLRVLKVLFPIAVITIARTTPIFAADSSGSAVDAAYNIRPLVQAASMLAESSFTAENPLNGLRAVFTRTGERVSPLDKDAGDWSAGLDLFGCGHRGKFQPVWGGEIRSAGNRVDTTFTGGFSGWYVNGSGALERGFELPAPSGGPEGSTTQIYCDFAEGGTAKSRIDEAGTSLQFVRDDGQPVLRYASIRASDADGRPIAISLSRSMVGTNGEPGVRITLDASDATFPIRLEWTEGSPKLLRASTGESVTVKLAKYDGELGPSGVPSNDTCENLIVIPNTSFPVITAPVDVTDAATVGDPTSICAAIDHTIWYRFTAPANPPSGKYTFTTCAASGASGTTMPDTVISTYNAASGCSSIGSYVACNDDDVSCNSGIPPGQSTTTIVMGAGASVYVLVGRYAGVGSIPIQTGFADIQLQVSLAPPPSHDTCATAIPLALNAPISGTTIGARDDYRSTSTAACFSGIGQTLTTAPGRDVVYTFTAPSTGTYSFRVEGYGSSQNVVLYEGTDCGAGGTPSTPTCSAGANRTISATTTSSNTSEEILCHPMTAGQQTYLFVDDGTPGNLGSDFYIVASSCSLEIEPNDTLSTAQGLTCGSEGSINAGGDVDFYSLGSPSAGSRVFAIADGVAANNNDFDLRITTAVDTLEYDDADNSSSFGYSSPNVAGTPLTSDPSYIRLNHKSSTSASEPYRLYSVVQPPLASATPETEPNSSMATATVALGNYFYGNVAASGADLDVYRIVAEEGDEIYAAVDADPLRDNTPFNPAIFMWDENLVQMLGLNDANSTSNNVPGSGSLTATTPNSPGEALLWGARYTGAYYIGVNNQSAVAGDYLLSISTNCQTGLGLYADMGVTMTVAPDPVVTFSDATYTVAVTNAGPKSANTAEMQMETPAGTTFESISSTGTSGWYCLTPAVHSPGLIDCVNYHHVPPDGSTVFTIKVRVNYCTGDGATIDALATVSAVTQDPTPGNEVASATTHASDPGTCEDSDLCTVDEHCDNGQCMAHLRDCDDLNRCTTDSCNPGAGCINEPTPGVPCDDYDRCTTGDACTAVGACAGAPVTCDDGDACTTDACVPSTGGCIHAPAPGTACSTGDNCTVGSCGCIETLTQSENFDAVTIPLLPEDWTTSLLTGQPGDIAWKTTTAYAGTPPNSAYTEDTTHVADKVLVSPFFLADSSAPVEFENRFALEPGFDGGVLEMRVDTGPWQDVLAAGGVFASGGYNGTISTNWGSPLAGRPAWTGFSNGFIRTSLTLPFDATGELIQLRWRVATDTSLGYTGQWIDSITLPVCSSFGCVGTPIVCGPLDQCHDAGTCDLSSGQCSNPAKADGTSCDDGDACTAPDACTGGDCGGPAAPPPPEINDSVRFAGGESTTISWTDVPGPYNVYRGSRTGTWVYNHVCFDPDTPGPSTDATNPESGEMYYYLISRRDDVCHLESILGRDSGGTPDPNPNHCP